MIPEVEKTQKMLSTWRILEVIDYKNIIQMKEFIWINGAGDSFI
jgi:hypothetical protein